MREGKDTLTGRQLRCVGWLGAVSPLFALLPGGDSGGAGWLAPVFAAVPLALAGLVLHRALASLPAGVGLGAQLERRLGRRAGRGLGLLFGLWAFVLAGAGLRLGGERLALTLFPGARPAVFYVSGLGLGLLGALGRVRTLGRFGETALPGLAAVLVLALLTALGPVRPAALALPPAGMGLPQAALEALTVTSAGAAAVLAAFLPAERRGTAGQWQRLFLSMGLLGLLIAGAALGRLGPTVAAAVEQPFFLLLRAAGPMSLLERAEALIAAQWVVTDFVLTAVLLRAGSVAAAPEAEGSDRRWVTLAGAAAALGVALFCPEPWLERLPAVSAGLMLLLPGLCLPGKRREMPG